jgi:exopolyphosphatase/guanosine-5'-triphosphate,3'-diphosphate pyrophosphatase
MGEALAGLRRFAAIIRAMGISDVRTVATAAVREAGNGAAFIERVERECGLPISVIDGEAEANGAAMGLISGIPDADGVVGDLGGGSLELVRVGSNASGGLGHRISLPIGALRLDAVRKRDRRALAPFIAKALDQVDWAEEGRGKPFYMVGGSWRALAQIHIWMTGHPLPIVHQYEMPAAAPATLFRSLSQMDVATLKAVPHLSTSRLPSLPGAAMLLAAVVKRLGSSSVIASGFGLREGLLYADLAPDVRALDPLIEAARSEGALAMSLEHLRGYLQRRAMRESDPVLAGDLADAALTVARISAEASALNQDRAQTVAAMLQAVSGRLGSAGA